MTKRVHFLFVVVRAHYGTVSLYFRSEYVKIFYGNGTEAFAVYGWDSTSLNNSLQQISYDEFKNISIKVFLTNSWSYVKIDYGIVKQRLNLGRNVKWRSIVPLLIFMCYSILFTFLNLTRLS